MRGFFAGLFLVLCAGLIGGGLQHFLGFARLEAALAAAAALAIFALFHSLIGRRRDRERVGDQIVDLSRGSADLLDYLRQGSNCRTSGGVRRCWVSCPG